MNTKPSDFLSLVVDVQIKLWGSALLLLCLDDPVSRQPYVLIFKNCRKIRWDVYPDDVLEDSQVGIHDAEADLIDISLGKNRHREPATITTDIFEVSVLYESFEIHKSQVLRLEDQGLLFERQLLPTKSGDNKS